MDEYVERGADEPAAQADARVDASEPQIGQSREARLRRERSQAMQENANLRAELSAIRDEIRQIREGAMAKTSGGPSKWEDLSEQELWRMATDQETATSSPHMMANALYHLQKKQLASELNRKAEELKKEIYGTIQRGTATADVLRRIEREFGSDALKPGTELFDLADQIYREELQRYGEHVREVPITMYRVVKEAKERLDALQKKPHPTKPGGPPIDERTGGISENAADRAAEQKSALAKGDWRGALRSVSKGLYADMNSS